jgi:prefoldin subunit 5
MDHSRQPTDTNVAASLARLEANLQNVAADVRELKQSLPSLDERVNALETESAVRKGREALILWLASTAASGVGALGMWALTHLMG